MSMAASASMTASPPPAPTLDSEGRYHDWGRISWAIVGTYVFLLIVIVVVLVPSGATSLTWVPYFLVALVLLFLVRYLTTRYRMDDTELRAMRVLGGRRVPLEEVRRIEYASLRDLAALSGFAGVGSWGWRGRMWSPTIGEFDSIYTDPARGLLVTAGSHPLFLSPRHLDEFARELSRRVRSYTGPLAVDVGNPAGRQ
jgi:Bacterial PH domain